MLGGRLLERENKRIYQISGLKSGRGCLRNLSSGRLRESFWNSIWLRNKTVIYKVVAYGRPWLLTRSGQYERVDCISKHLSSKSSCTGSIMIPCSFSLTGWYMYTFIQQLVGTISMHLDMHSLHKCCSQFCYSIYNSKNMPVWCPSGGILSKVELLLNTSPVYLDLQGTNLSTSR